MSTKHVYLLHLVLNLLKKGEWKQHHLNREFRTDEPIETFDQIIEIEKELLPSFMKNVPETLQIEAVEIVNFKLLKTVDDWDDKIDVEDFNPIQRDRDMIERLCRD